MLAGTFLGWLLHGIGKTYIFADQFCDRKAHQREYAYIIKIMIYNSSPKQQCLRNARFSFRNGKGKTLFESRPSEGACTWDTVRSKNANKNDNTILCINSYSPVEYIFSDWIEGDNYNQLESTKKIYFQYENRKNHTKKILINKDFVLDNVKMLKREGFS